jgi:iron complex outermembrane receptor protein
VKDVCLAALASVSLLALTAPARAQEGPTNTPVNEDDSTALHASEEIIVQARRRDESLQEVPLVVNAVTAESIEKLNIREFEEIENLVPGLQLGSSANGIGTQASLRGVAYDVNASGNNGTIEFYLNDAPLSSGILFQSMFDVGQIEVLRGPQGTLRGRASPSGSITVTTRRPDLNEAGGYLTGTLNDLGGGNLNGALNVPIIEGVLGIRLAGVVDDNDGNEVKSINSSVTRYVKTRGGRVSVSAEPAEFASLFFSYLRTQRKARQFDQVESLSVTDPGMPTDPLFISADDRLAVQFTPRSYEQNFEVFNWQGQVRLGGQKLDYVGSRSNQRILTADPNDDGAFFGATYPSALRSAVQTTLTRSKQTTHELRLSNEERIAGLFDYVIGGLHNELRAPSTLNTQTALFNGLFVPQATFPALVTNAGITPAGRAAGVSFSSIINTPVLRPAATRERSVFANLTAHIGDMTEISAGTRYIDYSTRSSLSVGGIAVAAASEDRKADRWIYSASVKHRFTDDLMAYASFGTSWRPGSSTNAIQFRDLVNPSPLLASFYFPGDETSESYEVGFKSNWLNDRVRLNVTAFRQNFENYAYSSPNVYVAGRDVTGTQRVFVATPAVATGVPAKVEGVEAEFGFRPTSQFDISGTISYAKSKIKNGVVPCNNYGGAVPTYAQILSVNNGQEVATCTVNYRAGTNSPFAATLQAEYLQPIGSTMEGYLRGLISFNGDSKNDPAIDFDDIPAYALVNLFAGIRDVDGGWEIGGYVRNAFGVERVLSRGNSALGVSYQQLYCVNNPLLPPQALAAARQLCPATPITFGQSAGTNYRSITMTQPREFGATFTLRFGSR